MPCVLKHKVIRVSQFISNLEPSSNICKSLGEKKKKKVMFY